MVEQQRHTNDATFLARSEEKHFERWLHIFEVVWIEKGISHWEKDASTKRDHRSPHGLPEDAEEEKTEMVPREAGH